MAVRSRVVITLVLALLLVVIALPLTIKGDGTLAGHVQIMLSYTLGLARVLLALVAVWSGCSAISSEITDRQLRLVLTKPVYTLQVWLGKWLGIMVLLTLLVLVTGVAIYGALRWSVRPSVLSVDEQAALRTEILVARGSVLPID